MLCTWVTGFLQCIDVGRCLFGWTISGGRLRLSWLVLRWCHVENLIKSEDCGMWNRVRRICCAMLNHNSFIYKCWVLRTVGQCVSRNDFIVLYSSLYIMVTVLMLIHSFKPLKMVWWLAYSFVCFCCAHVWTDFYCALMWDDVHLCWFLRAESSDSRGWCCGDAMLRTT